MATKGEVLAQRMVFIQGARFAADCIASHALSYAQISAEARKRFPLPPVERPREVKSEVTGFSYRKTFDDGLELVLQIKWGLTRETRLNPDAWYPCHDVNVKDVPLVAALLQNPTEEVPDPEDA